MNIRIYSVATLCTKQISEYTRMRHIYRTNIRIYLYAKNSTNSNKKYLSLILFEYSNIHTHFWLKKFLKRLTHAFSTQNFFMHKLYFYLLFFIKKNQANIRIGFWTNIQIYLIFKNLQMNIWIYSVIQKSTNQYLNIFVLGKWHEYENKWYLRAILFKYSNFWIFLLITHQCFSSHSLRCVELAYC